MGKFKPLKWIDGKAYFPTIGLFGQVKFNKREDAFDAEGQFIDACAYKTEQEAIDYINEQYLLWLNNLIEK